MSTLPPILILAGGKGTRLGELTKNCPKPMITIDGIPFLKLLIDRYQSQGFTEFSISVNYLKEQIMQYDFGVPVRYYKDQQHATDDHDANQAIQHTISKAISKHGPHWVVNGDTWPLYDLPKDVSKNTVLTECGINAGAQYLRNVVELVDIRQGCPFIDMGTPQGLECFKVFCFIRPD